MLRVRKHSRHSTNARNSLIVLFSLLLLFAFSACSGFKWNNADEVTAGSVSTNVAAIPTFTPGAGSYNTAQAVVVTTSTAGATICYTTNATNPDCNATTGVCTVGTTYAGPVAIPVTQTLMAIACKASMTNSPIQTGVYTLDTTPPVISAVAPAASIYVTNTQVSYTLSEQCSTASITWTQTSGTADPSSPHVQALVGAELTTGAHNNIVIANNPTLVAGATYSIAFNCTDLAANVGATVTSTNVTFDNVPPVISATAPASGAFMNTKQVSYTLSKNCASAAITWTQTGGTADPGSPRVQTLVGAEMTAGAHNNITLANNPALVSGAIYSLAYNCTDAAAQTATTVTNTGVTFDNVAPVISAITPASSTAVNHTKVSYTISENCTTATIKWTQTGGAADGASPHIQSLVGAELVAGVHNNFLITNNPTLVNGAIYTVAFDCSDAAGNNATSVSATSVTYNTIAVAISAVAPATSAYVNNTKVSYTYSASCATATITWTRTAGTADGGSPHVQSLAAPELIGGAHTNITLASNPVLSDGAVYTLQFDCTDAAMNASTPIVVTGVTYDVTAPVISAVSPVASAYASTTNVGYTLSEICATATITWTRTAGTADGASPHAQTLVAAEMTAGVHAPATITNNPVLISGAVYTIAWACTDLAGNVATIVSSTGVTFDNVPPTVVLSNLRNNGPLQTGFVIGNANDAVAMGTVEVQLDAGVWTAAVYTAPNWSFKLPTGGATWRDRSQHTINVRATDLASNQTVAGAITVRKENNKDVNGDGFGDVVVGAWAYSTSTGRAHIFYGSNTGIANATAGAGNLIGTGTATNVFFGRGNTVGDFNSDGFADVAVTAYGNSTNIGAAYIYSGGAGGLSGSPTKTISGSNANEKFGSSILSGDVNNDGYTDLVVGGLGYATATGRVCIFYGGAGGIVQTASNSADQLIIGEGPTNNNFGNGLAIGDFNGDSFTDLAVGAPLYSAALNRGRGYMFFGAAGGITGTTATPAQAFGTGFTNGDSYTGSMASGDLNGDGITDLIVGAYGYNAGANTGQLYIYYGPSISLNQTTSPGSPQTTITGTNAGAYFTTNMIVEDFNADGFGDLAVGAYGCSLNAAGCAYLFSGQSGNILGGLASSAGYTATGTAAGDNFGRAVGASDINGDGFPDLLVGANFYTTSTGRAYTFTSNVSGPSTNTAATAATTLTGQTTNSEFGITFFR